MEIIISAKTFKLTAPVKAYVTKEMTHALKFSPVPVEEARVELDHDDNQRTGLVYRTEMSVILGKKVIKAGQKGNSLRESIDLTVPKLIQQLRKFKGKLLQTKHPGQSSIRTEG
ncbi:MAG: HPF/RaiA family ribosome-associated protein [Patescibacteria group bacterium]|nr:HPF/RaiA family ribosome-associated protein [Patescibacteria group bacterium]MDD5716085.1 HPF/RaiA family ribosome-associated protein [Patescibacteria group bacterium]